MTSKGSSNNLEKIVSYILRELGELSRPVNIYPYNNNIPKVLEQKEIAIGIKYNGVNSKLVTTPEYKIIGYTMANGFFKYICNDRNIDYSTMCIFDTELMDNKFYIFDYLYMNGKPLVGKLSYKERFVKIPRFPMFGGLEYVAQRRMLIFAKFDHILVEKALIMLNQTKLNNDGFIIYTGIYELYMKKLVIFKYKPIDELTVDLLVKVDKNKPVGQQISLFALESKPKSSVMVPVKIANIIDEKGILQDGKYFEFLFTDKDSVKVTRARPDRTGPNRSFIIKTTYEEFVNYIPIDKILDKFGVQRETIKEHKMGGKELAMAKKFKYMSALQHKLKENILSSQTGAVLDCGFGAGADYNKYKEGVTKVYGFEPNFENIHKAIYDRKLDKDPRLELHLDLGQLCKPIPGVDNINFMFSFTYFFESKQIFDAILDVVRQSSKVGTLVNILTFDGKKFITLAEKIAKKKDPHRAIDIKLATPIANPVTPQFGVAFYTDLKHSITARNIFEYGVYKEILDEGMQRNGFVLTKFEEDIKYDIRDNDEEIKDYAATTVLYQFKMANREIIGDYKDIFPQVVSSLDYKTDMKQLNDADDLLMTIKKIKSTYVGYNVSNAKFYTSDLSNIRALRLLFMFQHEHYPLSDKEVINSYSIEIQNGQMIDFCGISMTYIKLN
jgi:hypothetical protein